MTRLISVLTIIGVIAAAFAPAVYTVAAIA